MLDGSAGQGDDLHRRLTEEFAGRFASLPAAPPGQRWVFECEVVDGDTGTLTVRVTAQLVPAIRVEDV